MEGITSSTAIFGIDFIREQQLVVAGDDIFFRHIPTARWNSLATLSVPERLHVPAHMVMRSRLNVRDLHINKLPDGTTGVAKPARDELGVWEALVLSLIHISEPTRPLYISYAVFCLKKKRGWGEAFSVRYMSWTSLNNKFYGHIWYRFHSGAAAGCCWR